MKETLQRIEDGNRSRLKMQGEKYKRRILFAHFVLLSSPRNDENMKHNETVNQRIKQSKTDLGFNFSMYVLRLKKNPGKAEGTELQ
jgi:HD-like signal output (HDOD) protein